ncbi:hypothetical protein BH23CHL4_BH23CHL4_21140 [soil metagenome]
MARVKGCEAVYEVADQWRERCLERDGSLLWPDLEEPTWTVEKIRTVRLRLEQAPQGKRESWKLLLEAVRNDPPAIPRLVCDLIAIWSLLSWVPASRKSKWIEPFVELAAGDEGRASVFDALESAFDEVESIGLYLGDNPTKRNPQMTVYLDFAQATKSLGVDRLDSHQAHTTAYDLASRVTSGTNSASSILYRLFPEQYEALPHEDKRRIVKASRDQIPSNISRIDEELHLIRTDLNVIVGRSDFSFFDDDIAALWQRKEAHNHWLFQCNPEFYDLAQELIDKEPGWQADWNVTAHKKIMKPDDQVAFWQSGPEGGLMAIGRLVSEPYEGESFADPGKPGWWVDWILDHVMEEPLTRDFLKEHPALGKMPPIAQPHTGTNFRVSPEQWGELMRLIGLESHIPVTEDVGETQIVSDLQGLATLASMDIRDLAEIEELLLFVKPQLIFEGPTGSGKTFIAEKLARYFKGTLLEGEHDDRVEFVQFHQSYGYEDFVQGIRPVTEGGMLTYRVVPGIFLEICERAEANPEDTFVLIIDEINRGNLSRIFGELLMALEYREKPVKLANPGIDSTGKTRTHLTIPRNLYLIGTMNSTDRSLAMIDYALRRRFYFYPLRPVVNGEAPVLERWLAKSAIAPIDQTRLLRYFISINQRISSHLTDDFQVGHSYFMNEQVATVHGLQQVWDYALKPLLQEYFHSVKGGTDFVDEFDPVRFSIPVETELEEFDFDEDQTER